MKHQYTYTHCFLRVLFFFFFSPPPATGAAARAWPTYEAAAKRCRGKSEVSLDGSFFMARSRSAKRLYQAENLSSSLCLPSRGVQDDFWRLYMRLRAAFD